MYFPADRREDRGREEEADAQMADPVVNVTPFSFEEPSRPLRPQQDDGDSSTTARAALIGGT